VSNAGFCAACTTSGYGRYMAPSCVYAMQIVPIRHTHPPWDDLPTVLFVKKYLPLWRFSNLIDRWPNRSTERPPANCRLDHRLYTPVTDQRSTKVSCWKTRKKLPPKDVFFFFFYQKQMILLRRCWSPETENRLSGIRLPGKSVSCYFIIISYLTDTRYCTIYKTLWYNIVLLLAHV